jgi:outer membrane lipoprotein-sorting protein
MFILATLLALASPFAAASAADHAAPSAPATAHATLAATRTLAAKLARSGRGEASVTVTREDPLGGPEQVDRGRLALEIPDRVRLEFPSTGEKLAVRGDGGEWVQPAHRQMVRIRPEQAGLAAWLWEVFLTGGSDAFAEQALAERRYALEPRDGEAGLPERIEVTVDAKGLPEQVAFTGEDGVAVRYRFKGWRFLAPKGSAAFKLPAPAGYTVVEMP